MSDPVKLLVDHLDVWTGAIERKSGAGRGPRNGNSGKISLYGIDKLRSLILDLAVRGKLVPQDPADGDARELLKRLQRRRPALIDLGFIRKSQPVEKFSGTMPFAIPKSWEWVRLDQVGAIVGGGTPPANDHTNFAEPGDGIPWLTPADLGGYRDLYISRGARDLTDKGLADGSAKLMPEGTVLFTSRAPIGYVAIASNPISTNQGFKSIVPFDSECSRYIALAMRTFADDINANAPGTTFKEVSGKIVGAVPFPLPPLAEQKRIVAKVDELMALVDALEAGTRAGMAAHETLVRELLATLVNSQESDDLAQNWSRIEAHFDTLFTTEESIDALKQAVLELAVRGELETETSNEPTVGKDGFPMGWKVEELSLLTGEFDSGWSPACPDRPVEDAEDWGVLKTTAIQDLAYHYWENKALPGNLEPRPKAEVKSGDVIITRAGPYNRVGVVCFVDDTRPQLMLSDKLIRFRPKKEKIDGEYLALALRTGISRNYLIDSQSGMAKSQVNISQAKLAKTPVPFPSIKQQKQIVKRAKMIAALLAQLKERQLLSEPILVRIADSVAHDVGAA